MVGTLAAPCLFNLDNAIGSFVCQAVLFESQPCGLAALRTLIQRRLDSG
jgi:hypothetical protein